MAILHFVLHVLVQLTVSLVGLARADIKYGLLYSLGLACELLIDETRIKYAGVTVEWMKALGLTWRPWRRIGIGVSDGHR